MANQENNNTSGNNTGATDDPKIPGVNDEPITNADEDANTNISDEELALLDQSDEGKDGQDILRAELDNIDADGEPLNETVDFSGGDLDVPGSEQDDDNEAIGEEDEENNLYSNSDNDTKKDEQ
ncbi:MAG: hypothetical protein ABIN67_13435 [Ferruginibacter sp.]